MGEDFNDAPSETDQRFCRYERLLSSLDYQRIFNGVQCKSADRYLTVLACQNSYAYPRLGLAITKKKIKTSVARQRIKRLIRESFRHHKGLLAGLDIVVMSQSGSQTVDNKVLFNSLMDHWQKLAQRCKKS